MGSPIPAPRVASSVRHAAGSCLSCGCEACLDRASPAEALPVTVSFTAFEKLSDLYDPLGKLTRLIARDGVLVAEPLLFRGARASVVAPWYSPS